MPHVFAYGSLMFDPVWARVVTGSYDRFEAILKGYERKGVRNEVYPVIVPSAAYSQVKGIVYPDVSLSDLARLDQFEGEYYYRKTEQIVTRDTAKLSAEVYVLKEEYYAIISFRNWDPDHFSTIGIHFFIHAFMETDEH
jgi:gamma-glutamylcyclotransferase (GGCT)/AIG2-like uncharacterized protein YtfP